jgi:pyridoxal phosphate enzyme (YggS family)
VSAIADRLEAVRGRIAAAARAAGRAPDEITLVAVSKFHPAAAIEEAIAAGATALGENYVQELLEKQALIAPGPSWHFIGRLQRNKVRMIVGKVALIHAVDGVDLAAEISKRALAAGAPQPILLAVNAAGEASKGGVPAAELPSLLAQVHALPGVRVDGLMTMPPPSDDPAASAPYFQALRALRDQLATPARPLPVLSMGMSDDLDVAIAAGATHVRIGTAIFGRRPTAPDSRNAIEPA